MSDKKRKMSSKDFETALIDMVVAYCEQQKTTKKKQEILKQIIDRVSAKKGGAGGEESETDGEAAPAKAKRAPSAYNVFMAEIRAAVAEKNPGMKPTDITTEIGRLWNIKKENPEMTNDQVLAEGYPSAAKAPEKKLVISKKK
jgi:hypothetical protein